MWFDKQNPIATFLDKRPEVNPTFICDTTKIPDEVGNDFDLVVFDPPHENVGPLDMDIAQGPRSLRRSKDLVLRLTD